MARVERILERLRPVGTPGTAAASGVPANRSIRFSPGWTRYRRAARGSRPTPPSRPSGAAAPARTGPRQVLADGRRTAHSERTAAAAAVEREVAAEAADVERSRPRSLVPVARPRSTVGARRRGETDDREHGRPAATCAGRCGRFAGGSRGAGIRGPGGPAAGCGARRGDGGRAARLRVDRPVRDPGPPEEDTCELARREAGPDSGRRRTRGSGGGPDRDGGAGAAGAGGKVRGTATCWWSAPAGAAGSAAW